YALPISSRPTSSATPSHGTTVARTSRCSSPSRWSATSSASSPPRGLSRATRRTTERAVVADLGSERQHVPTSRRKQDSNGSQGAGRSEEHTSELQSRFDLVCRLLLEK